MEIEGTQEFISSLIGDNIINHVKKIIEIRDISQDIKTDDVIKPKIDEKKNGEISIQSGFPQLVDTSGLTDVLRKLFSSDWSKSPRALGEIKEALEINAIHYDTNRIGDALTKLCKKGEIRRIGSRGNYQYIPK